MPIFEYECRQGHRTEDFSHSAAARPPRIRCSTCKRVARYVVSSPSPPMGDVERHQVQPHFNPAFGEVVMNRKHMTHLQKKHGTQDWRPVTPKSEVKDMLKRTGKLSKVPR